VKFLAILRKRKKCKKHQCEKYVKIYNCEKQKNNAKVMQKYVKILRKNEK